METGAKCLYSKLTQLMISIMRQSPGEGDQDASSPPQICLLCEDMFTTPERVELQGKPLSHPKVLLMFFISCS